MAKKNPARPYIISNEEAARIADFPGGRLPDTLQHAVEQYIAKKTGKNWRDPVILERLRGAIIAQKDDYWKPQAMRSLTYTKGYSVLGYLAYHFPVYFMQAGHILAMLARDGLLKDRMAVLDIGTGPGVVPLAFADFCSQLDGITAGVYSLERSEEHIEAFLALRDAYAPKGGKVSVKPPMKDDIAAFDPAKIPQEIDLMVFSNVLNETGGGSVEKRADIVLKFAERLTPDGSILIIEPAEENTSTQLRALSLALKKRGLTIFSPCTFVHGTNCTPDRCWSFVTQPGIRPTRLMEALAGSSDEPFRYINTDIKYSYVVIRKDGRTKSAFRVSPKSRVLRLSYIHRHVEKRINVIAAKMSENLGDAKTMMFRVCDGSADKPVFAVLPAFHVTPANEELVSAPYGSVLSFEGVLVRHNAKHDSYNLLISRNTVVSMPDGPGRDD